MLLKTEQGTNAVSAIAYFQGQFVPEENACVNIKTHAFLYGTSIFEGIRGYWNPETETMYLMKLREHYERMLQSAKLLFMQSPLDLDGLVEMTCELVRQNRFQSDIYLQPRLYKSGLIVPPRLDNVPDDLCCFMLPFGAYVDTEKGLKVCVSNWRRVSDNAIPPRGKIGGAYVNTALAMGEAHMNGYDDAIFLTEDGQVSEGSGMNLYLVKNGKLYTPRSTDNILEGITRGCIAEIAEKSLGLTVEPRLINRSELYLADEVFFTGTAAQVAPVTNIDNRPIGTGKPGPITDKIQALYMEIAHGKRPEYQHWLTPVPVHALSR